MKYFRFYLFKSNPEAPVCAEAVAVKWSKFTSSCFAVNKPVPAAELLNRVGPVDQSCR